LSRASSTGGAGGSKFNCRKMRLSYPTSVTLSRNIFKAAAPPPFRCYPLAMHRLGPVAAAVLIAALDASWAAAAECTCRAPRAGPPGRARPDRLPDVAEGAAARHLRHGAQQYLVAILGKPLHGIGRLAAGRAALGALCREIAVRRVTTACSPDGAQRNPGGPSILPGLRFASPGLQAGAIGVARMKRSEIRGADSPRKRNPR
jgi:hypothetical protein